ncbi:hypothetical protein MNEG_3402 [Monoraphidium neglectum]|uniref:Uncharacterized protein n=1 Tax=Monoraphidium neglectum TaxID=145388 RepID=A0A0D2MVM8_9CHLO|nr:hypothetical protein MNEG_3402 [Monoraphidium neglectum]KIZ04552.1 hypothetical protein MNEG_3402 [Monoraphidium neglectum]|eukprot:XP_013903571.1 hypothetical protein MNEG_3402 [Monoraphidium neglectum]
MVFHLAAPYIQDQLSLRSWKPTGTLTVRVKYRGPFRLPAVRVIGVLSGPAQPERLAGAKARAPGGGGAPGPERAAAAAEAAAVAAQSVFWGQSKEIASSAVSMWNTMVETHTARWSQSLQTLQRVSSRLFRSVSHDSVADAGFGGGPASTSPTCAAPSSEEPSGGGAAAAAPAGYQQRGDAATAAAAADGAAASAEHVAALAEQEALLQRQLEQLGQLQSSLAQFVTTASRKEVHLARMLADLSNIAYDVTQIVDDAALLESRHGLRLVACSHPEHFGAAALAGGYACPLPANGGAAAPLRHAAGGGGGVVPAAAVGAGDTEGDAEALFEMQLHPQWDQWLHWEAEDEASAPLREPLGAAAAAAPAATCWDEGSAGLHGGFEYSGGGGAQAPMSPRAPVVVSAMAVMEEGEAAAPVPASCCAALSPASGTAAPSRASRASSDGRGDSGGAPAAAQLCSSTAFDCALPVAPALDHQAATQLFAAHHAPPQQQQQQEQQQEQEQQGAAHSAAPALDAGVPEAPGQRQPQPQPQPQYPADWFVCDAPAGGAAGSGPTRYIVIQGSITVDHWRINLTFDPVPFVDGSTGVKVHRWGQDGLWGA